MRLVWMARALLCSALRERGRLPLRRGRRWHRSRAWCVLPTSRRADGGTARRAAEHQRGRDVVQQVREAAHPGARGALQLHLRCAPAPDPGPDQQSARLPQPHARALAFPQARGACKPRRCPWPTARPARRADTDNGNSGGPVWVAQDGKRYLIGIHVAGGTDLNYGTRISTRVEAFIVNAMAKGG